MDVGSSYLPSDMLAAFLYAQLEARDCIQSKRQRIWEYYDEHLRDWAADFNVQLPTIPPDCEQTFHMYYLVLPTPEKRHQLLTHLNDGDINSVFHYQPLHLSRMGREFGGEQGHCPVSEDVSERLLRLPFYTGLSEADQCRIVSVLKGFAYACFAG